MKILTQTLLLTCCILLPAAVLADTTPDFDVLKSMSVADFRATGLDHLSDAQIKALDAWIADYQHDHAGTCMPAAAPVPVAPAPALAAPSTPAAAPADTVIVAHLAGTFRGWGGGTRFKLDNGQVWEQVDDSVLDVGAIEHPKVTIKKGLISAYYLSVEGVRDTIAVRRVSP